jgi:hypothetical protein
MTDEELVKALRDTYDLVKMWPEKRPDGFTNLLVLRNLVPDTADRIEALTEQLEAARADAKEAEAYAEGLERDLKICRMAQAVMDNTVAELERERDHWQDVAGREGVCMACRGPRGAPEPYGCSDCLNTGYCGEWHNEMGELREKLAKAVEALRLIEADCDADYPPSHLAIKYAARSTLAEIEGEKG